jgi:hypothetical protein
VIQAALRAALVICVVTVFLACSGEPPDRPDREPSSPEPRESPTVIATPEGNTKEASGSSESSVVENTVGDAVLRRDESVLRIGQAELLRAKEGDEIFVKATVKGPVEAQDCYLMKDSTWFALRDAIESEDLSDAPDVLEVPWADPTSITKFTGGDTLAISFRENTDRKVEGPDTEDTSFFVVCYKVTNLEDDVTWYDVAHVEGTPEGS